MAKRLIIFCLTMLGGMIFLPRLVLSQTYEVKGVITDQDTRKPMPFVNIGIKDQMKGTTSDLNGEYRLELPAGEYTLVFSFLGYEKYHRKITAGKDKTIRLDVSLRSTSHELNMIIVSASKYEQKIEEAVSTVEILKPSIIENKNITSLDKAVEQVPGVAIIDNEPQIRGGSGFSSGLGSRVLILVDEIPMMRADAGRPVWGFLPVEDVEQIEVVKGASSVVYGSSALNGAINIRTAYPKEEPQTKITLHGGIYNDPPREYAKSWDGFNPVIMGASFLHSKRVNHFDYVLGGNFLSDPGYIGPAPFDSPISDMNKGEYEKRGRMNFGTRVRSRRIENLTYGLNGNFMYSENAQTFFWQDSDTNIYRSYPGALTNFKEFMFYVDPYVKYFSANGSSHSFKNRYFFSNNGADHNQTSRSQVIYNEYQFSRKFKKAGNLILSTGIMNMYSVSHGEVFSGEFGTVDTKTSDNLALYAQLEKKFFNRLTFLLGGRWEYFQIGETNESKPVFRTGINLKVTKITYARASFGQGYRFPSIGERYITTYSGSFGFYPNPDLKSENSWNAELGIKQLFKISKFMGFFDVCGFWQEYENYVEFNAGLWGNDPVFSKNLGFKFVNTGDARVRGLDITLTGEGNFFKNLRLGLLAGYTYSLPEALEPKEIYFTDSTKKIYLSYIRSSSDTTNHILKYRIQHLAKLDVEAGWKNLSFGISGRYYSFMKNIDKFFYNFDGIGFNTGIKDYRKSHDNGILIFDARLSYDIRRHFKIAFIVNNVLNDEYSLRPISIEPPRTTMLQIIYKT